MENVHGRFVFDDGKVTMNDVNFKFRGAPVKFARGTVFLEDTGQFDLNVNDLWVEEIRFDPDLRKKMPPLMAQFALRLDDGRTFRARGDLKIGWTGEPGEPAWCSWKEHAGRLQRQHGQDRNPARAHSRPDRPRQRLVQRRGARG